MVVESVSSPTVYTGESTEAELVCAVYGYPRDSSSPVWTNGSDPVQDGDRISITVASASLLSGSSVSSTNRVESRLTISNVTEEDSGEYTCSVQGNSSTVTLTVESGKFISYWLLRYFRIEPSIRGVKFSCFSKIDLQPRKFAYTNVRI